MIEYNVNVLDNGDRFWYNQDGQFHREDGPAVEYANGTKVWWLNGLLHREDGPAVKYADGTKKWYLNGRLHREDGPAIEWANGAKEWWLNGKRMTEEEFNRRTSKVIAKIKELTIAEISELLGYEVKVVK